MDRQTDRQMEEWIHLLCVGWRNLPTLRVGWRNLFSSCAVCCVSFWFWQEIEFGCTYYYVLEVPYSCGVVLVFLVLAGNSFWCYIIRIRMIDGTHTNSYVATHMYHFGASTTAPYLDFFINITCQRFLPSYLEAEARKWDEIQMGGLSEYHHKIDMSIHGPHR